MFEAIDQVMFAKFFVYEPNGFNIEKLNFDFFREMEEDGEFRDFRILEDGIYLDAVIEKYPKTKSLNYFGELSGAFTNTSCKFSGVGIRIRKEEDEKTSSTLTEIYLG